VTDPVLPRSQRVSQVFTEVLSQAKKPIITGKFGYRAGKSPPNTNNVNLFFSLQNATKKKDKQKNKINNNK